MVCCCIFYLLRCLSSLLHGLSSPCATVSRSAFLGPLGWLVVALSPSCLAGCCIAFPHAATYHLPATLPFIAPLPLIIPLSMPLPFTPLVRLVVAVPLLKLPPPICRHLPLSLRHGLPCLLSGWLLHCLSSHRRVPSPGNLYLIMCCCLSSCPSQLHAITSCSSSLTGVKQQNGRQGIRNKEHQKQVECMQKGGGQKKELVPPARHF
jgi:hypothetical protein